MIGSDADLLRPLPIFAHFGDDMLKLIAFSAARKSFEEGAVIFREGESADCGYLVVEGSVLMTETIDGEEVERAIYGPGSLIGEIALITATTRPATAIARAPTRFLVITRELMTRVLAEDPRAAEEIREHLRERLAGFREDLRSSQIAMQVEGAVN